LGFGFLTAQAKKQNPTPPFCRFRVKQLAAQFLNTINWGGVEFARYYFMEMPIIVNL
jgi:hypothetical protein